MFSCFSGTVCVRGWFCYSSVMPDTTPPVVLLCALDAIVVQTEPCFVLPEAIPTVDYVPERRDKLVRRRGLAKVGLQQVGCKSWLVRKR